VSEVADVQPGPSRPAGVDAPRVVAVGGGHGLSASLRAIRRYAGEVTAVVSVADDGGSSGRLREEIPELPAPGDVRKCLGALAAEGSAFARILEHRFDDGAFEGHALGNLLLVSLALELGSFEGAVDEVAVSARDGRGGRAQDPRGDLALVCGQVAVHNTRGIRRLRLRPEHPASPPAVAEAIAGADQVVIGPGSLFTSVLAATIVPAVRDALAETSAQRVFLANLSPQLPETDGFDVADEVAALLDHEVAVDVVVVDRDRPGAGELVEVHGRPVTSCRVAAEGGRVHDPERLGRVLDALWVGRARVR
jgi:2-phospho-L-lactate transferase/gluconeogenesis factor (CofD/UPF0052 family)